MPTLARSPYDDFWAITDYIAMAAFATDMVFKFFLAYIDNEEGMIRDHHRIAVNYLS